MENHKGDNYAGFWIRLASSAVDGLFIYFAFIIIFTLYFWFFYPQMSSNNFLSLTLYLFFPIPYLCVFLFYHFTTKEGHQSPGKKLFKLEIVDDKNRPLSAEKSFKRTLLFLFDTLFLGLGHYFILFNSKKQALHDRWTGTFVKRKIPSINPRDILIVAFCFIAFMYVGRHYMKMYIEAFSMPTTSMEPSVFHDDFFLVDKHWPRNNTPQSGDLIVFQYPKESFVSYTKRCIAIEGQTVEVRKDTCFIDGEPEGKMRVIGTSFDNSISSQVRIVEIIKNDGKKYTIQFIEQMDDSRKSYEVIKIPEGYCYVLGDNRDNSADSRSWGLVPNDLIIGKLV